MSNSEDFKPIETQEDFDRAVKDRLARERRKIREEFPDYDELKQKVAEATGLPLEVISSLSATDEEALTKQAKAMAKWAKPKSSARVARAGTFAHGGSSDGVDAAKRELARQIFGSKSDE